MRNTYCLGLGLAAAIAAGWWLLREPAHEAPPALHEAGRPAAQTLPVRAPDRPAGVATTGVNSAAMRSAFETAPNYAAFIQDALQRPAEGGRFYALLAWNRCEEISGTRPNAGPHPDSDAGNRERARQAFAALTQRCEGVKGQFPDQIAFWKLVALTNARGTPDALLIERGPALLAASMAHSEEDLKRAYGTGDPYLIASTFEVNADFFSARLDKEFADGQNRSILYASAAAASCEFMQNCQTQLQPMLYCVASDHCAHLDYRDFLREDLEPAQRTLYDRTRNAILQHLKNRTIPG